jgi:hypothetical protein
MTRDQRHVDTEPAIERKPGGIIVSIGRSRWTVPTVTILGAALTALGTAYKVAASERAAVWDAIEVGRASDAEGRRRDAELSQRLEIEQVMLAEIKTQLARIDARVAEVQVTLMRGGH